MDTKTKTYWRKTFIGWPQGAMGGEADLTCKYRSLKQLIRDHGACAHERYELVTESVTKFTFKELKQLDQEGITSCEEVAERRR